MPRQSRIGRRFIRSARLQVLLFLLAHLVTANLLPLQPQLLLCFAISCWWGKFKRLHSCSSDVNFTLVLIFLWPANLSREPSINSRLGLPRLCYLQRWICKQTLYYLYLDIPGSTMQPTIFISAQGECCQKGGLVNIGTQVCQSRVDSWSKYKM